MLLVPSSLQNSNLPVSAKRCILSVQHRLSDNYLGIDGINLSGIAGDEYFGIIFPEGLVLLSFKDPNFLATSTSINFLNQMYKLAVQNFSSRLHSHSVLKSSEGTLLFPFAILYVFPDTSTDDLLEETLSNDFINKHCCFKEWFSNLRLPAKFAEFFTAV